MLRTRMCLLIAAAGLGAVPAAAVARPDGSKPISIAVFGVITSVPDATLDAVGVERLSGPNEFGREKLTGARRTKNGKPEILAANLSWCPHCAANSWSLVVALERFGDFTKLRVINTGRFFETKYGGPPSMSFTKGISFYGRRYASEYISFSSVVVEDLKGRPVQKLTKSQQAGLKFSGGGFPAVNVAGLYGTVGSGYGPEFLGGKAGTTLGIAQATHSATDPVGRRVDSVANFFTAAICQATDGMPADVCTSTGVKAAEAVLPA